MSLGLAAVLLRRRAIAGLSSLAFALIAAAGWSLVAGLEAAAVPLDAKILFSKMEYAGSGCMAVLFLLFACRYTGRTAWMTRLRVAALWLLPAVSISLAATNGLHGLLWTGFAPGPPGTNTVLYQHGPAFFGVLAGLFGYVLIASYLLVSSAIRASAVQRRQSFMILLGTAFPWISGIHYALGVTFLPGLNLIPVSFAATGIILTIGILQLRLFELVPVARNALIEGMTDGVLVVDSARRIIDVNPAARRIFSLPVGAIGEDAVRVFSAWPQITDAFSSDREVHLELTLSEDPLLHVDLGIAPLTSESGAASSFLIDVRDISARYRAETELQDANERLQTHVREIERLQAELHERAIRDALTGLFNRRHLDEVLPRILARAARDQAPVSILLFDIDRFKQVNDSRGHLVGDALLVQLGAFLATRTRAADVACRYGGEEFLLVLPDAALEIAASRAEALRSNFRTLEIPDLAPDPPPTLSAGIAVFPQHGATQDELVRAADEALYRAKADGRNCVRVAQSGT
jgi:diguanylate cyclase (GGDEF)-like protein